MQPETTYQTYQIWVKPGHRLYPYFAQLCGKAKALSNTTNFFIRQVYTSPLDPSADSGPADSRTEEILR